MQPFLATSALYGIWSVGSYGVLPFFLTTVKSVSLWTRARWRLWVFISLKPLVRMDALLNRNSRKQKARGASRCLHSHLLASMWMTRLSTDPNKPIKYNKTCLQNRVRGPNEPQAWETSGCSVLCASLLLPNPTSQIRLEGGFVLNQASLSGTVMGKLPKKRPVIWRHYC